VYYLAKQRALANDNPFHVAAFSKKGHTIGVNSNRCSAKYRRYYAEAKHHAYRVHAEVDLLLRSTETPDQIYVMRFLADGQPTMAKPCIHCQNFLRLRGVKKVRYTDWEGNWAVLELNP
jgi:deoxycytidylate deaminase